MDDRRADYFAAVQSMRDRLGANAVPIQIPVGQEEHHRGVVDLVEMRAITYVDDLGTKMEVGEIPAELAEQAQEYHHQLIDAIAEYDDELTETYLYGRVRVTPEMIRRALRTATPGDAVTPVLLGSAFKNKGVQPPRRGHRLPAEPARRAGDPGPRPEDRGGADAREASPEAPFSALAFKVMSDPSSAS